MLANRAVTVLARLGNSRTEVPRHANRCAERFPRPGGHCERGSTITTEVLTGLVWVLHRAHFEQAEPHNWRKTFACATQFVGSRSRALRDRCAYQKAKPGRIEDGGRRRLRTRRRGFAIGPRRSCLRERQSPPPNFETERISRTASRTSHTGASPMALELTKRRRRRDFVHLVE
jgi:hypothetical protein